MSRAFVKENDDDQLSGDLPERPLPAHVNYVTARGLAQLQTRVRELSVRHEQLKTVVDEDSEAKQKLREIDRDLRYFRAQLERAELVDTQQERRDEVHFGAAVIIEDESGKQHHYRIVGDDEANVATGDISWASPLARALIGTHVGDAVTWRRPAGNTEIEVIAIHYADAGNR